MENETLIQESWGGLCITVTRFQRFSRHHTAHSEVMKTEALRVFMYFL